MHSIVTRDYLAYAMPDLDLALGSKKSHEPASLFWARAVVNTASELPAFPSFLDPVSQLCFAGRLLPKNSTPAQRKQLVDSLMNDDAEPQAHAFLQRRQVQTFCIAQADAMPARDRGNLVAVENEKLLVNPDAQDDVFGNAVVVICFPQDRKPELHIEVLDQTSVRFTFYTHHGARNAANMVARPVLPTLTRTVQNRKAAPAKDMVFQAYNRQPASQSAIPDAVTSRLSKMMQEHLRLPVLLTAAAPRRWISDQWVPTARPLAMDRGFVSAGRLMNFFLPLHPTSCACACRAYGASQAQQTRTTVVLTVCGGVFGTAHLCPQCKRHEGGINGICTRHFSIELRCAHKEGDKFKPVLSLPLHHGLSTAARSEFLHVLALLAEFFQSKRKVCPARVGALDNDLLRVRVARSNGDNDNDALEALVGGDFMQEEPGILKLRAPRSWTSAEKRVRETHAHLFPLKRMKLPPLHRKTQAEAAAEEEAEEDAGSDTNEASARAMEADAEADNEAEPEEEAALAAPSGNTLFEYIDAEGLERALQALGQLAQTCSGRAQLRAQSFLHFLQQLKDACETDGEFILEGPCDIMSYRLPVQYKQKRGFGRLVTANVRSFEDFFKNEVRVLCLQGAPRLLRPFLCGRFCRDFDMINAQPTILLQLAARLRNGMHRMPTMQQWVDDRPGFIAHIAEVHDIQDDVKDTCKNLIISLIFGGEYEHWLERHKRLTDIQSPLVKRFARELADLRTTVFNHIEFANHVSKERARHAKEGVKNAAAADRSIFAVIAQNEEHRLLDVIRRGVVEQGFAVESLQYDGLFVVNRQDRQLKLAPLEAAMKRETGYDMRLLEKELLFEGAWPEISLT